MEEKINNRLCNGYVREPVPIVILAIVVLLAFLVLAIWSTVDMLSPATYETEIREVQFIEYKQDGPIYEILSAEGTLYDLPVLSVDNLVIIDSLIDNGESVLLEVVTGGTRLDILSVSSLAGDVIISSDRINQAKVTNARTSVIVMWTACMCYLVFVILSYYFISNAPRYPRIAALLVRKEYRNF